MTPSSVRFCVGCGYVCDEVSPENTSAQWMEGHGFVTKYGLRWEELARVDDVCPACARVFAIARQGTIEPPLYAEVMK
ncbi:hypothetical protein [Petrachloros mirabilis]